MITRDSARLRWASAVVFTVAAAAAAFFFGLSRREFMMSRDGFAMNTIIRITVMGRDRELLTEALNGAFALLERLDDELSLYNEKSALSMVNAGAGEAACVPVPEDVLSVIGEALKICRATGGVFNPLIGPVTKLWKINQDPADAASFTMPGREQLDAALSLTDPDGIEISGGGVRLTKRGAAVDLGGIAKGYASSRIADLLSEMGIRSALIDLGGNIQVLGARGGSPWRIGIRDPLAARRTPIAVLPVTDTAVITSGGYERYKIIDSVRYSHFFDPRTGMPVRNDMLSATLVTPDGAAADALATAFMIMGPEAAKEFLRDRPEFGAVLMLRDGSGGVKITATRNLKDKIRSSATAVEFF